MIDARAVEMTKHHEGLMLKPYLDTVGKMTIGFGRNLDDMGISQEEAETMLTNDLDRSQREIGHFSWFQEQNAVRRSVLIMLCFNLGLFKLLKFKKMIAALKEHDYDKASDEMINSKWATQVHGRADELALMMRAGAWLA